MRELVRNRQLIFQMTRRDVAGRYRGSVIGVAWSLISPLVMLAIYTFVFSGVFGARWGGERGNSTVGFSIVLFAGLIVHGLFAECVNRAPGLILANTNLVKRVVFPLSVLPWVALGSAAFHSAASLFVLLAAQLAVHHTLPWTVVLLPVVVFPLVMATMGFAWMLSALGVFVRDIGQMTGMITSVALFLSPVFYPLSAVPARAQRLLYLNPLTPVIEDARNILIFGEQPVWSRWAIMTVASLLVAQVGFWFFQRLRKGFADVL